RILIGLAALFIVMTAVVPLRRIRNLDVAALCSFLAPVLLLQRRYIAASVISALPGLLYLSARCAFVALGPGTRPAEATPLYAALGRGSTVAGRIRLLRVIAIMLVLVFVMVGVSSGDVVDVISAVMEGATKLLHG